MNPTFAIDRRGNPQSHRARLLGGIAGLALFGGVLSPASAATWTWDGSPSSGSKQWNNANMWNPNTVPASDGTADLIATSTQFWPVVMGANYNINTLTFGAAGHTLNSGNTLTFSNSGAGVTSTGDNTIAPSIVLAAASTFASSSGLLTVSGTINNGGFGLTLDGAGNVTLSNAISGAGGLTMDGDGTLNLSGTNTYGGMTTVNSGTLVITNGGLPNALNLVVNGGSVDFSGGAPSSVAALSGSGIVTNTGGTQREFKVNNSSANSFSGQLNGNLKLTKTGAGKLTLSGNNNFSGDVDISDGTVAVAGSSSMGSGKTVTFGNSSGVLDVTGQDVSINGVSGSGTVTNSGGTARTLTVNNASANSFGGQVNGNLGLTKTGAGKLTLSGSNGFSGNVSISDGTVEVAGSSSMGSGKTVTFGNSSGVFDVTGQDVSINGVSGSGVLTNSGGTARTLTVNNASANSFGGQVNGNLGLTKTGAGKLTLSGSNGFSGNINISDGTVEVAGSSSMPGGKTVTFGNSSGVLDLTGQSASINGINGGGSVTNSGGTARTLTVNNASANSFGGQVNGNLGLTKTGAGKLTLSGSNGFSGNVNISDGTVEVAGSASMPSGKTVAFGNSSGVLDLTGQSASINGISGSGAVTNSGGTARTLTVNNASANSFGGQVNGNLGLTKTGAGKLTLSGSNSFSGNVNISDGTVEVVGSSSMPGGKTFTFGNSSGVLDVTGQNVSASGISGGGTVTNSGGVQHAFTLSSSSAQAFTGAFTGNLTVNKSGSGSLTLPGSSSHSGGTNVQQGKLIVNGSITGTTTVSSGADLGGSGSVGRLVGGGSISPGNSPGVMTGTSTNASGGLDYNFEFTATGSPNYTNATASINDVLRLTETSGSGPFEGVALGSGNTVNIYLNVASLPHMSTFRGGFYTDLPTDFLSLVMGADFQYYMQDAGGGTSYNGNTYSPLSNAYYPKLRTVADIADFDGAGGNPAVNGRVMQLRFDIPEPSSLLLLTAGAGLLARRRRR
ncbi:MAG: autotransporter-associated beta strand repeat-containing protein [Planctomycetes bacterium]|nr:autotransporter-associated beta strand repeat-containing protein [Planctomycetota bacterium]